MIAVFALEVNRAQRSSTEIHHDIPEPGSSKLRIAAGLGGH